MEVIICLNISSELNNWILAFDNNRIIANHIIHYGNVIYSFDADNWSLETLFFVFHLSNLAILQFVTM